jgi:hypothetical protein
MVYLLQGVARGCRLGLAYANKLCLLAVSPPARLTRQDDRGSADLSQTAEIDTRVLFKNVQS